MTSSKARTRFNVETAKTLNQKLQFDDVGLLAIEAKLLAPVETSELSFGIRFDEVEWQLGDNHLFAAFPLAVGITEASESGREIASIQLVLRGSYRLSESFDRVADLDATDHFLAIVGWLQMWPYLRAEVQQLSNRLGLPPLVLPVLLPGQTADLSVRRAQPPASPQPRKSATAAKKAAKLPAKKGRKTASKRAPSRRSPGK